MILKLHGLLGEIDSNRKLRITFLNGDDSREKLARVYPGQEDLQRPYNYTMFFVSTSMSEEALNSLRPMVSRTVDLEVKVRRYNFISQDPATFGVRYNGFGLYLQNIELSRPE